MTNVVVHSHTSVEHFVKTTSETFSHVWLDLTCTDAPTELLWNLRPLLRHYTPEGSDDTPDDTPDGRDDTPDGRDAVYLTLSKRCRTLEVLLKITTAVCNAVGFKITHMEEYTGTAKATPMSCKRNMLFFVCAPTNSAIKTKFAEFNPNMNAVGSIAYVTRGKASRTSARTSARTTSARSDDTMVWRTRSGKFDANVAFVRKFLPSPDRLACSFFDKKGNLGDAIEIVPCEDVLKTATWTPRLVVHKP